MLNSPCKKDRKKKNTLTFYSRKSTSVKKKKKKKHWLWSVKQNNERGDPVKLCGPEKTCSRVLCGFIMT